jgi:hypothetical protein
MRCYHEVVLPPRGATNECHDYVPGTRLCERYHPITNYNSAVIYGDIQFESNLLNSV